VRDVPARPAVRTPLLIAGLGWLLVAAAFYWQIWLELHLRLIVLYGVDLAVLVVAFVPAVSITVGVYELWKRRRRRQVALLAAVTVLVGAAIVVAPWQHGYMWTRFVLHRSDFDAVAARRSTAARSPSPRPFATCPRTAPPRSSGLATVRPCCTGAPSRRCPADRPCSRCVPRNTGYTSADRYRPPPGPPTWICCGSAIFRRAAGRSATAGGGWTPATDRPDGRSGPPEPSAQRVFPLNTGVRDRHTEPSGCTNTESNPSAAGELA
jgi:hypothetical protein